MTSKKIWEIERKTGFSAHGILLSITHVLFLSVHASIVLTKAEKKTIEQTDDNDEKEVIKTKKVGRYLDVIVACEKN